VETVCSIIVLTRVVKAILYVESGKPGAQNSSTLTRHTEKIRARVLHPAYFLEYNPADLAAIPNGLEKLVAEAQNEVDNSHPDHLSPIVINHL